jgi:hypothetical protein
MEPKTEYQSRLEEILAEWDLDQGKDYESINMRSISLPSTDDTITISASQTSPYTYTTGVIGTSFPNAVYTTSGTASSPWSVQKISPKIQLDGENADITVNGWSLVDAVKRIEERLDLFQLNPELEAEWAELRELGEQYRQLEQQIKAKMKTWDRLKAMPKIEVD